MPLNLIQSWHRYLDIDRRRVVHAWESWAQPVVDGTDWFERIYQAITTRTGPGHCIYIAGWVLDHEFTLRLGDPATALSRVLRQKAEAGVDVRVLLWLNPLYNIDPAETSSPPWLMALRRSEPVQRLRSQAEDWVPDTQPAPRWHCEAATPTHRTRYAAGSCSTTATACRWARTI